MAGGRPETPTGWVDNDKHKNCCSKINGQRNKKCGRNQNTQFMAVTTHSVNKTKKTTKKKTKKQKNKKEQIQKKKREAGGGKHTTIKSACQTYTIIIILKK